MEEIWKDIEGYEGCYQVSNQGRVRSLDRQAISKRWVRNIKGKILSASKNRDGYLIYQMSKDGVSRNITAHRLVAMSFINNKHGYKEINHLDENKENNKAENLEWTTRRLNMEHSVAKWWHFISPDGYKTVLYNLREFCNQTGLSQSNMQLVHNGSRKTCMGWTKWNR